MSVDRRKDLATLTVGHIHATALYNNSKNNKDNDNNNNAKDNDLIPECIKLQAPLDRPKSSCAAITYSPKMHAQR
jgi:hypothetical protein